MENLSFTFNQNSKSSDENEPAFRHTLDLDQLNKDEYCEIDYLQILRKSRKDSSEETSESLDGIPEQFLKYTSEKYVDGYGYEDDDGFIDNSEAYDENVPVDWTTKHGGFYINQGELDFTKSKKPSKATIKRKLVAVKNDKLSKMGKQSKTPKKKVLINQEKNRKRHETLLKAQKILNKKKAKTSATSTTTSAVTKAPKDANKSFEDDLPLAKLASKSSSSSSSKDEDENNDNVPLSKILDKQKSSTSESGEGNSKPVPNKDVPQPPKVPPPLPTNLSEEDRKLIEELKKLAEACIKGKFFTPEINQVLLRFAKMCKMFSPKDRNAVYDHVTIFTPCARDTLLKRCRALLLQNQRDLEDGPIKKLKEEVAKAMTLQKAGYDAEVAKALQDQAREQIQQSSKDETKQENGPNAEEKAKKSMPKRKFNWSDELRKLLCEVVHNRVSLFKISKSRYMTGEEYIKDFLENEIRKIWPKGWMTSRILYKESRQGHLEITQNKTKTVKVDKKQGGALTAPSSTTTTITTTSKVAPKSITAASVSVKLPAKTTSTTATGTKASTAVLSLTKPNTTSKVIITGIKNITVPTSSVLKANSSNQKVTLKASTVNDANKASSSIFTITSPSSQTKPSTANTSKTITVPPLRKLPASSKSAATSNVLTTKHSKEKIQYSSPIYHQPEPRNHIDSPEQQTTVIFTRTISNSKPTLVSSSLPATSSQNDNNIPRSTPTKIFSKPQTIFSNAKPSSSVMSHSRQEVFSRPKNHINIDEKIISVARGLKDNKSVYDEGIKVQRTEFRQDALQRNSNSKQESLPQTLIHKEPASRNSSSSTSSQRNIFNQRSPTPDVVTPKSTTNQGVTQRTIILGGQKEEIRSKQGRTNLHQELSPQKSLMHFENHPRNQLETAQKSRLSSEPQQQVTINKTTTHHQSTTHSVSPQQQSTRVRVSPQHPSAALKASPQQQSSITKLSPQHPAAMLKTSQQQHQPRQQRANDTPLQHPRNAVPHRAAMTSPHKQQQASMSSFEQQQHQKLLQYKRMALTKEQFREASQQQSSATSLKESQQRIPTSPQKSSQSLIHQDMSPRTVVNHKAPQRMTVTQAGPQRTLAHHEVIQRQPTSQHISHRTTKMQHKPLEHYSSQMLAKVSSSSYMSDDGHSPINNQRSSWMTVDEQKRQQLLQSGHSRSKAIPNPPSRYDNSSHLSHQQTNNLHAYHQQPQKSSIKNTSMDFNDIVPFSAESHTTSGQNPSPFNPHAFHPNFSPSLADIKPSLFSFPSTSKEGGTNNNNTRENHS
eukprot:TCONS_00000713-protein